jgi:single-strand DNA-binding protein
MSGSINKVILVGNVGKPPEIRTTQDGKEIAALTLATSESWRDKNTEEKKERTEWHRIVVFQEGLVNIVKNYVKKGMRLYIEGTLRTRKWTDSNNVEKYTTEVVLQGFQAAIVMLERASSTSGADSTPKSDGYGQQQPSEGFQPPSQNSENSFLLDELADEVPF